MSRPPIRGDRTRGPAKYITVVLLEEDREKLCGRVATASGGLQSLLRRIQSGVRVKGDSVTLTMREQDVLRVSRYWAGTGGKPGSGGYQQRLPIRSLREYLPTVAPLFMEDQQEIREGVSYVYFKQEDGQSLSPIKIGRGSLRRSSTGYSTDNPRKLVVLLRVEERSGRDESYFHHKFARHRKAPNQEWFWPADELLEFIRAESAEQELQEQRRCHDASSPR